MRAQLLDRVLGRLGLELARGGDAGHEGHVDVADVLAADVLAQLADRLEERQRLDVADRAADLGDDDVGLGLLGEAVDAVLDLVGDVRDDLHGAAEEVAAALLADERLVDRAGGDVAVARQRLVDEALVVAQVEVGLGAVVGDEHLAVLERAHRARVDVEVRVELLDGHLEPARLEQPAERCRGDALAERGDDASGHEDVLGRHDSCPAPSRHAMRARPVRDSTLCVPLRDLISPRSRVVRQSCRARRASKDAILDDARERDLLGGEVRTSIGRRRPPAPTTGASARTISTAWHRRRWHRRRRAWRARRGRSATRRRPDRAEDQRQQPVNPSPGPEPNTTSVQAAEYTLSARPGRKSVRFTKFAAAHGECGQEPVAGERPARVCAGMPKQGGRGKHPDSQELEPARRQSAAPECRDVAAKAPVGRVPKTSSAKPSAKAPSTSTRQPSIRDSAPIGGTVHARTTANERVEHRRELDPDHPQHPDESETRRRRAALGSS